MQRIEDMTTQIHDLRTAVAASFEVKADRQGRIEGYASTVNEVDRGGDVVLPGAFTKSLGAHTKSGTLPVMLWSHQIERPVGRWTKMSEDIRGLYVEGTLNLKTEAGREAFEHVDAGDAGGLSIGYTTPDGGRVYAGEGTFHLKEVDLLEVSIVTVPMNPSARITGTKSLGSKAEAIDMLRDCGLSRKAAARFAAGGWAALNGEDVEAKAQAFLRQLDQAIENIRTVK